MKKILFLLLVSLTFLHNAAEGATLRILGTPYQIAITALNEQGTVTGKWWTKVYGPLEKVWISTDRDRGRMQTTRPGKDVVFSSLVFWNFKEVEYSKLPLGDGEIHMNNSEVLVIQHDLGAIIEKVYEDGNVKKRHPDAKPETVVLYPDGTHKQLNTLSEGDKVYYFDDNGDVVFKSGEEGKELYYSLNVYDATETFNTGIPVENVEGLRKEQQKRLSTIEGKKTPATAVLEQASNDAFYSIATTRPIPPHLEESTNKNFGWHIQEILLANGQGQFVAKARYVQRNIFSEIFLGQEVRSNTYYIYIDLN